MNNEDKIVEVFLSISDQHLNRYSELPLPIQEKLKEKFLLISTAPDSSQKILQQTSKSSSKLESSSDSKRLLTPQLDQSKFADGITFIDNQFIKFELSSTRESVFSSMGCFSTVTFIGLLFFGNFLYAILALGSLVTFFYLLSITDDYILYDINNKKLLSHKKLGSKQQITELAPHRYIKALGVQGKKCSDKNKSWWEYQAVAVTLDGDLIPLSDFSKNSFYHIRSAMQQIGNYLQIESLDYAIPESTLEAYGAGTKIQLLYSAD